MKVQKNLLAKSPLIIICGLFFRPQINYRDIIYDRANNSSFHLKLESIQYNYARAITAAVRKTIKETN